MPDRCFTRFTILGAGSSGGVPRIGPLWGACDQKEPKNRRMRSSFLIEKFQGAAATRLLVDTSPDLRAQLLMAGVSTLDGVIYTHSHADHTHGIDDLRVVYFHRQERIPVFYDSLTGADLLAKFGYCFEQPADKNYVPILDGREIPIHEPFSIDGPGGCINVTAFPQHHGNRMSLGLRFGNLVYSTDVHGYPDESERYLDGLEVLIIDCLRYRPHPSHFTVGQALEVIERVKPKRAILTHLLEDLDYATLAAETPGHVEPAYDGLQIEL